MNGKFKYYSIYLNVMLMQFSINSGYVITQYTDSGTSGELRIKRQAGYVYDKPTVSFDLPTATPIATTQAPTVDRIQMQMYYAYPVPSVATGDAGNGGQQNTVSSAGSTTAVSSGANAANGYSYGVQNSVNVGQQNAGSSAGSTTAVSSGGSAANGYNYGVQNSVNVGQQNTGSSAGSSASVSSGANVATGYNYGIQNTQVTNSQSLTLTDTQQNTGNSGYRNTAVTGTQAVISSGSSGYGDGRPTAVSNSGSTGGAISTSAPRYLPPTSNGENNGVSVTNDQAQMEVTITRPSDTYIPQSVQVSGSQNDQVETITQSAVNAPAPSANPSTSYLQPNNAPAPSANPSTSYLQPNNAPSSSANPSTSYLQPNPQPVQSDVSIQPGSAQSAPTAPQQYLPPSSDQKPIGGSVATPAFTYLPPVF